MTRRPVRAPLNVFLNNRHVGRLTRQASGAIEFAYVDDWLALPNAIPVSLPLRPVAIMATGCWGCSKTCYPIPPRARALAS